jgi:hypothetical protein
MRLFGGFIGIVSLLAACDASKGPIAEPEIGSGKADVSSRVMDQGSLEFGAPRTGAFAEDLEFHGFRLSVRAGAVVTLDNTHLGTAAKLDSTLFVYGPRGADGFGASAIAFDDDSGWGKHARLRDLVLEQAGEYLVVLGTADARGRGHYRLEARCENGACEPLPAAPACHAGLADGIQRCIAEQIADADLEGDTTIAYQDALAICTDGEAMGPVFDEVCNSAAPPAFCALDFESFFFGEVPTCAAELGARFGLGGEYHDEVLTLATEGLWFTSESDYLFETVSWPAAGPPTEAKVLAASGLPASSPVESTTFTQLFDWRARAEEADMDPDERESVRRYRHLRRVLEDNLTDTLVVRIGSIQIHVFAVGRTSCGEIAGVSSIAIET